MPQTNFAGLIQDPGINAKMQLFYRFSVALNSSVELPEGKQGYTNFFLAKANRIMMDLPIVDKNTMIDLKKYNVGTFKGESKRKLLDGLFCIYRRTYISVEKGINIEDITSEIEEKSLTKEEEKMLRSEFNELITRTNFPQEFSEDNRAAVLQNDFLRGGTITFLNPQTPIENPELSEIQKSLYKRYKEHFDLNNPSNYNPCNLKVKNFDPENLESEYKFLINQKDKIKKIYNGNNLSENDKKYCEQALEDISSFLVYFTAQMTTIVNLETPATVEEIKNCQENLLKNLNLNTTDTNEVNKVILSFNKSSADFTQNLLYLSERFGKTLNETAILCKDSILESRKSEEINRRNLENVNMEDRTERGKVDAIQYNPNDRYQRYVFCNFFDCGKNTDEKNTDEKNMLVKKIIIDEANMLVKKNINVINNLCTKDKNIKSNIDELRNSKSPLKIFQKKNLENELNESNKKLNGIELLGYYFNMALSKISDNKNQNKENINKDFLSVINNSLINDLDKIKKVIEVFCDSDINKNYVGVLSSVLSNKNLSDKDKIEFLNHLYDMGKNGIEQSPEEFSNLFNGVNSVTKSKKTIKDFNENIDQKISEKNKSKMQENTK